MKHKFNDKASCRTDANLRKFSKDNVTKKFSKNIFACLFTRQAFKNFSTKKKRRRGHRYTDRRTKKASGINFGNRRMF